MKTSTTLLTTGVLLVGLVATVYLAQRPQPLRGRAEESQPTPTPTIKVLAGDYNHDGSVDSLDYNIFLRKFEAGDKDADLDKSGVVNSLDLNKFLSLMER